MYFWNISKLKEDLISKRVSEREKFHYLWASAVFSYLDLLFLYSSTREIEVDFSWGLTIRFIDFFIGVIGTYYLFQKNGGEAGMSFLERITVIGFVSSIRWIAFSLLGWLAVSAVALAAGIPVEYEDYFREVFFCLMFAYWFVYTGRHIKEVSESSGEVTEASTALTE